MLSNNAKAWKKYKNVFYSNKHACAVIKLRQILKAALNVTSVHVSFVKVTTILNIIFANLAN